MSEDLTQGLGRRAVRGSAVAMVSVLVQRGVDVAVLAVLARLLTPVEFGLFGMTLTITAFVNLSYGLGLSFPTIQRLELTPAQASTMFWVNAGVGVVLGAIVLSTAPLVATFYDQDALISLLRWLAISFLLGGLGTQHLALLERQMRFGRAAACRIGARLVGGGVALWMAQSGSGVMALVGQALAASASLAALAWILSGWIPGLPVRKSGVGSMLSFGGFLFGFSVTNYIARNGHKILLGRFHGAGPLGLFARAFSLMLLPTAAIGRPLTRVMVSTLSKFQDDPKRLANAYMRVMGVIALVSFPIAGGVAVLAEEAVLILFGSQWTEAIPLLQVLCVAGVFMAWIVAINWLFITMGHARRLCLWGSAVAVVAVAAVVPCIWHGPIAAAIGYTAVVIGVVVPLGPWFATRGTAVGYADLMRRCVAPLACTILMAAVVYAARCWVFDGAPLLLRTIALTALGVVVYVSATLAFARAAVRDALDAARRVLRRSPAAA